VHLLSPWILARLVAGVTAAALFVHGAWVSLRILRFFRLGTTSEGQLALERQFELASATARVGAVLQASALLLSLTAANQLAPQLRGAMCGYGVVHAVDSGPLAVAASALASLAALVLWRLLSFDRRVRGLQMLPALASLILGTAALALLDLGLTATWLGALDFSVVASCCSSGLDAGEAAPLLGYGISGQKLIQLLAPALVLVAAGAAWRGAKSGGRGAAQLAGAAGLAALPAALAVIPLVVAPHVYEVPHHRCPYCLFRADALGLGYLLLGSLLVASSATLGAALLARLAPREPDVFPEQAPALLRAGTLAWLVALGLGLAPVLRYLALSGGVPLL
jgi:hypothetical protein